MLIPVLQLNFLNRYSIPMKWWMLFCIYHHLNRKYQRFRMNRLNHWFL